MDVAKIDCERVKWRKITAEGLNLDYTILLPKVCADQVLRQLEETLEYFTGDLAKVKVFGRWHPIPRQQVAHGEPGISYKFSGTTVPALPWTELLSEIRDKLNELTGHRFDFVLINRYRNGNDHMGEHRDDESELDSSAPIASLSLGQRRTFVLKHKDARKPGPDKRNVPPVKLELEHGSLLMMNPPTNKIWYHSLPKKKSAIGVRINMTFRKYNANVLKK
ncbi:DNA oxidative demethylase ALKBH2-like [Arctopsyche grandis]|uniref:DNA oxidative demethylase ALKBH2-like n=1 Tax=Arctopsyche grandis TaxID=121162 RepID=UPI00406D8AA0